MFPNFNPWIALFSAFVVALVVCNLMTPPVKRFAENVGAMDIPKDERRVHDHPIPRMGGLAIIVGFFLAVLLFVPVSEKVYGIVIGAFEESRYKEYELQLEPGSKLFVYTDGVAEAMNTEHELFGMERTLAALNAAMDEPPEGILRAVDGAVAAFVGEAEQFDDLTMLCLEYKGK